MSLNYPEMAQINDIINELGSLSSDKHYKVGNHTLPHRQSYPG